MRQVPAEKYNIAWFKLAEFVARGEKERALGIYRLLIHSFDDRAFSFQLEGDLLWSFNDEQAVEKYLIAAQLYQKDGRTSEAIGVYELLVTMCPENENYLHQLLQLYQQTENMQRLISIAEIMCGILLQKGNYTGTLQFISRCETHTSFVQCLPLHQTYILALIKDKGASKIEIQKSLQNVLSKSAQQEKSMQLHQFLTSIEVLNKEYYDYACTQLKF